MNSKKYRILVLSDLKQSSLSTLNSTIGLAKKIDAEIDFFHVKSPIDVVHTENALSAIGDLNRTEVELEKKIKSLIAPFVKEGQVAINYSYSIGSVKRSIKKQIQEKNPDIIVMGKRQSGILPLVGNNITDYVLQNFDGNVMIASKEHTSIPSPVLFAGYLNDCRDRCQLDEALSRFSDSGQPIKTFKIVSNKGSDSAHTLERQGNHVDFVFEKNEHTLHKLSDYVKKNNINLLFVDRGKNLLGEASKNLNAEFKGLLKKMSVSLFVLGGKGKTV